MEDFSSQPFRDSLMFHKNLSNIEGKIGGENGRSRMVTNELAVGSSQ
jgi:hypothetical protein